LLSDTPRKNGWQIAQHLGDSTPDGVQHLLARADWDVDAVRNELIHYLGENLGEADGVLIVDETGFLKKGTKSAGVARQYSGTAGRIENAQIGVFLAYATRKGQALIDRELYLPKEWRQNRPRCQESGVPDSVEFTTKIGLAKRRIQRSLESGILAKGVTADAVYGSDYSFRIALENQDWGYVVGVRSDFAVGRGFSQVRASTILAEIPSERWDRRSAGRGSKGPRLYDWAWVPTNSLEPPKYARWLLIRRSLSNPAEVAYFAWGGPPTTTLEEFVQVAGRRWGIEECFELAKGDCGLDEYEVRSWTGWYRHMTLSLLARAVVVVIHSRVTKPRERKKTVRS
jgi:SRSO17 transposase